jgi:DNA-binding transcriptional MerR regulator
MSQATPDITEFTIRDVARLSGLPASTLRYYESIGLLAPVSRDTSSGHRRYQQADVDLAIAIACLSAAGLPLPDMRTYLENRVAGDAAAAAQIELLSAHADRLVIEAQELELRRRYLDAKLGYWRAIQAQDSDGREHITQQVNQLAAELHRMGLHGAARRNPGRPAA